MVFAADGRGIVECSTKELLNVFLNDGGKSITRYAQGLVCVGKDGTIYLSPFAPKPRKRAKQYRYSEVKL